MGNGGRVAVWKGVAPLGLSLPLSPPRCILPPVGMGWLFSGVSQSPLFCKPPAVCSGRLIFLSLSHSLKKLPLIALRAFGPVLTLSNAGRSSPFRPYLLVVGAGVWGTFLLGVAFRLIICGPYIFPPS